LAARATRTGEAHTPALSCASSSAQPAGSDSSPLTPAAFVLAGRLSPRWSRRPPKLHDAPPGLAVPHQPGADLVGGPNLQHHPLPRAGRRPLRARPEAGVAAFWLVWPLTTATGPRSGSAGSASTTNQRDRPRERTTTGAPPTGTVTPDARA